MKTYPATITGLFVLAAALFSHQAEGQTNLDATMTVDNQFTAYLSTDDGVQGTQIGTGNDWPTTYQFGAALTPGVTNYLHILATDTGPPAMFIGEFNLSNVGFEFTNGTQTLLTNTTDWQVSTTGFGANYMTPNDLGGQGTSPWGTFPLIDAAARFIWHPGGPGNTVYFSTEIVPTGAEPEARARILVSKDFSDDNTAEVEVTLSCNTGLPLEQTTTISEGDPVNFVVGDFEEGALDCEVTEVVPEGYTASYDDGSVSPDNCSGEGLSSGQYACEITNTLDAVEIVVTKEWIDENPQFAAQNVADADWSCSNVASGSSSGFLQFFGNPGSDSFFVFPDWESGTTCSVTEIGLNDSGVEVDDSDCQGLVVFPGGSASCTIVNTRLFEGIPTLSQYGLAVLALLMLGVGFVAFRRLI